MQNWECWIQTGLVVGSTLYGVWSSQKGGKERAGLAQRRGAMLTEMANKRIKQRNKEMLQTSRNIYDKGGEAVISAYLSSTKQIQDTKAEASGSGAVLSGTIDDVMRAQKSQSNSMQEAIVQNTNKNIESLTRQTKDQELSWMLVLSGMQYKQEIKTKQICLPLHKVKKQLMQKHIVSIKQIKDNFLQE